MKVWMGKSAYSSLLLGGGTSLDQQKRIKTVALVLGLLLSCSIVALWSDQLFVQSKAPNGTGLISEDDDGWGEGGVLQTDQVVLEASDDFGTPPTEEEEPPTQDVFSNKIEPPPLTYDESNPKNFTFRRNAGIHIITTFFKGTYPKARVKELVEVLRRNINNPYIEAVHILYEKDNPRKDLEQTNAKDKLDAKLVTMKVPNQPTYFRLFGYANAALERGSIAIVANSDIYFDKSLRNLKYGHPENETEWRSAMALSRSHSADCGKQDDWKGTFDLCSTYIGSHDAFVFAPPAPDFVLKNSRHTQNNFGAENIIVFGFIWARGFRQHLSNPCKRVRAVHLHCTTERHYEVGAFISQGRHGNIRPGVKPENEDIWNLIY